MPGLEISFLGIRLPNPFLLASGPPSAKGAMVVEAFKMGWGGAALKTISLDPTPPPSPRVHVMRSGKLMWGMLDIELFSDMTVDQWEDEIDRIRDAFPDRPILASISGTNTPESWQELAGRLGPHGISAFEMNTSCPNFGQGVERGSKLGQDPEMLGLAVSWVRAVTKLPLIVKLTPNATDLRPLVRAALEAGADGFCAGNSLSGIGGVDLDSFAPLPSVNGVGMIGGYGGPGLRPVSLRCTADIVQTSPVPVFGCGGISKWQDAVEYLAVGASAVQICTAVMLEGYRIIRRLTQGLDQYLQDHGLDSVARIIGRGLLAKDREGLLPLYG